MEGHEKVLKMLLVETLNRYGLGRKVLKLALLGDLSMNDSTFDEIRDKMLDSFLDERNYFLANVIVKIERESINKEDDIFNFVYSELKDFEDKFLKKIFCKN